MEVMVPALAKAMGVNDFPNLSLEPKPFPLIPTGKNGVFVADWDSHGNIYLVSTFSGQTSWVPQLGETSTFHIGNKTTRLRHVDGIFAGKTGEQTLTVGSLSLNGNPVYYIVVVGGNAHALLGNPTVGTPVEIEEEE